MNPSLPSLTSKPGAFPLPTISEDTLHYTLHLPISLEPSSTALLVSEYVESFLPDLWLWHKDAWELKVASDSTVDHGKLEGTMRVGDAVDDEWLIVWLLREVSKKWSDIITSIRDTDGEFLLIEAANELPQWVSPENAENRLWLYNGHLHLLPLHVRSSGSSARYIPDDEALERQFDPEAYLTEEDALRAVRTGKYGVEKGMESVVWDRISHYPAKLSEHHHRAKAYLPLSVAKALSIHPALIQRAVEGFYVRDPAQLRAAAKMAHFPPSPSVLSSIKMSRAAYAQLQGQVFHPPRIFGPEWTVREDGEANEKKWRDLGVKIATGFEIMYREGGKRGQSGQPDLEDVRRDKGYQGYIDQLKSAGFFGKELEGSEKWKQREVRALQGWNEIKSEHTHQQKPSFAYLVDSALTSTSSKDASAFEAKDEAEDSDAWLEVSPDELDGMMMRASGQSARPAVPKAGAMEQQAEPTEEHGKALKNLAQKVQQFVGGEGDMIGARFEDELSDDDDDDEDDEGNEGEEDAEDAWQNLTPAQKEERMQSLVAPLGEGEWGTQSIDEGEDVVMVGAVPSAPKTKKAIPTPSNGRAPIFAKQEFDGVVDESDSEDDEDDVLPPPGTLGRQIAEMRWADTAPKIEEVEDEDMMDKKRDKSVRWDESIDKAMHRKVWEDHQKETGEDQPIVVDEESEETIEDVDMGQEQEAFLRFAREALGVNDEMWEGIVKNRADRGAFVPALSNKKSEDATILPDTPNADGQPNMALDSFDKVMAAMDVELARVKPASKMPAGPSQPAPKPKEPKKTTITSKPQKGPRSGPLPALPTEADLDAMTEDDLMAMDRELRAALKGAGIEDDDDDDLDADDPEEVRGLDGDDKMEYKMMKDLLESYKSQAGESGVVGNLFGRLGQ